jgi:two-component system cell cycle sensor histidine kinase/response regulator CckA
MVLSRPLLSRQIGGYDTVDITTEHQQRLELVGRMATGIAHDLNNQMMVILNHLDFALGQMPAHFPVRASISDVQCAAGRCAEMVASLLAFGSSAESSLNVISLEPILAETGRFLRRTLPANIDLRWNIEAPLNPILADMTQIQQVVMNLAINARDAMPRGGKLLVDARSHEGGLALTVWDTGSGISTKVRDRVFEPFVTTKSKGVDGKAGGAGLGLATVAEIVKRHGAEIELESVPGKGTCFRILFPCPKMK